MHRSKDTPTSLARKLKNAIKQPQIHRYLEGSTKEPRRATLKPLADYYKIDLEALYNPKLAAAAMQELQSGLKPPPEVERDAQAQGIPPMSDAAVKLGQLYDLLAEGRDVTAAYQAATQALIEAVSQLGFQPSGTPAPAAKREKQRG